MLLWPFNKYPGTDYETFNWEWVLKTVKEWVATMQTFKNTITAGWEAMQAAWEDYQDDMNDQWQEFIDDTYKDQITEILEQHPEWVTTVMDGAITYNKLNSSLQAFVTPEMYGAIGDGITDDSVAIRAAAASGRTIFAKAIYKLDDAQIVFADNTNLIGGKFIVPSTNNGTAVFRPGNNSLFAYIEIESVNDKTAIIAGSTPVSGSTSSNRYAFYINEKDNVKIKDVDTKNLYSLAFITSPDSTSYNNDISIENCTCVNANLPVFAAMCKGLKMLDTLLHTGSNADNGLFHCAYITYGVDGCYFENIDMVNEGLASSIHFQVGSDDYTSYNMKCKNIRVNGCRVTSNASIGIGHCENCTIENLDAKIAITSGSANRSLQIQNDSDNISFKNCNFNFDSETSVYMGETSSNINFNKCTFVVKATRIFNNMAELLCTFCSFEITNKSSSYPTLIGPGTAAYSIKLVKCVVTGSVRFYITTGADVAGSTLKCDGLEVYKTADANSPGTAIDVTNAAVEVLNSIFIGYTTISNSGTLTNKLSQSATYT